MSPLISIRRPPHRLTVAICTHTHTLPLQLLYITQPENWTAAAMYAATRQFASNLKEKMAQRYVTAAEDCRPHAPSPATRHAAIPCPSLLAATHPHVSPLATTNLSFYNLVLLPRIRDDIAEFKRLNFHLFMALKKALFKPAAFFKGILLPICEVRARRPVVSPHLPPTTTHGSPPLSPSHHFPPFCRRATAPCARR